MQLGMATALETLCGQAFGAKKYAKLGVYLQRSWIVLFLCSILLLPTYFFTSPILKFFGQSDDIAELSGTVAVWAIPAHFSFAFFFPINRFLQSQLKNMVCTLRFEMSQRGGLVQVLCELDGSVPGVDCASLHKICLQETN